jgi:Na+/H+-translocating membrane pyrophosphatase
MDSESLEVALLSPILLILMNYLSSIGAFFFRLTFAEEDASSFAALNIRWQIILASIVAFFIYLLLPFGLFGEEFSLESEAVEAITFESKQISAISWCCLLGLIMNLLHVCIFEWLTSHGCPQVRNLVYKMINYR